MSNIDKQARQVSRYDLVSGYMQKWPDGEFVYHSDYQALLDELEAAEKRIAELDAVKFKFSDSKLLSLAKDIVENLVDAGGSDPEYTQQYVDWTCKRIRAAAAGKGE